MVAADNSGLVPGGNTGGSSMPVPTAGANNTPAIGASGTNSLIPQYPGGQNTPPINSTINAAPQTNAPTTQTVNPTNPLAGLNIYQQSNPNGGQPGGGVGSWVPNQNDFIKAMHSAGFSAGDAALMYNFLQSGAGFNPQVAQSMIDSTVAAEQPGIQRKEADILEQFGSQGMRNSSSAAIGMGDFLSQVQLGDTEMITNLLGSMYEQSVSNYMNVLMGGKGNPTNLFSQIMQGVGTLSQAAANGAKAANGG